MEIQFVFLSHGSEEHIRVGLLFAAISFACANMESALNAYLKSVMKDCSAPATPSACSLEEKVKNVFIPAVSP